MDERLKPVKYINDPVYGGISITKMEMEIIDTPIFQRLRGLRQLAKVNYVFPSAEHSRYIGVNNEKFLNFNDSFLEVAFEKFYEETDDDEYKKLYEMYRERIRPKVVFELKDLYEESPTSEFSVLKWELKRNPDKITNILGTDRWGYQIVPITIEKIHSHYTLTEGSVNHEEELREAVKLYDIANEKISYLAEDKLSVVNKLANYKSEFIRIYVLEEKGKQYNYEKMYQRIKELITS